MPASKKISAQAPTEPRGQKQAANEQQRQSPMTGSKARKDTVAGEPVKSEPIKSEPVESEPVKSEPVQIEPVKLEPVKIEPVKIEPDNYILYVETWTGKMLQLRVSSSHTIRSIKDMIYSKERIPQYRQILLLEDQELKDHKTLERCQIGEGYTLDQRLIRYVLPIRK